MMYFEYLGSIENLSERFADFLLKYQHAFLLLCLFLVMYWEWQWDSLDKSDL